MHRKLSLAIPPSHGSFQVPSRPQSLLHGTSYLPNFSRFSLERPPCAAGKALSHSLKPAGAWQSSPPPLWPAGRSSATIPAIPDRLAEAQTALIDVRPPPKPDPAHPLATREPPNRSEERRV